MYSYWPYDETQFEVINAVKGAFRITTPWLVSEIEVRPHSPEFHALQNLSENRESPDPKNMGLISKVLSQVARLPIAYQLPRQGTDFGKDTHQVTRTFAAKTPRELASELRLKNPNSFAQDWAWDHAAVLEFSQAQVKKFDPLCLLTVARRFHYLDCSDNKIGDIYPRIEEMTDVVARRRAVALVVRQNHYVTALCQASLAPALKTAKTQVPLIEKFMREEKGHDLILSNGLNAMGLKPDQLEPTAAVQNLMRIFGLCAELNFLAFGLSVDFFEKPEFRKTDPLAAILTKLNEHTAARALQAHKNINEHGEHDGFSLSLLAAMKAVDAAYATQALQLAELVSFSISQVPHELEKLVFN